MAQMLEDLALKLAVLAIRADSPQAEVNNEANRKPDSI